MTVPMSGPEAPETPANLHGRAEHGLARRRRTRARIVEAAFALLGQETGAGVQIDEIVARAGVSRGTFYNYFDSREHLLNAMAYELNHGLDLALAHAPDPATRAALAVRAYLHKATTDPAWGWAMVNVSINVHAVFGEDTHHFATETLQAGIDAGLFRLTNLQAGLDLVMGSTFHAMRAICEGRAGAAHAEDVARLILLGLGVTRARAERLLQVPLSTVDIAKHLTADRIPALDS
jgi:AcrR family transcriptional regulator